METQHSIGEIGNYYGGLLIKKEKGKYFWSIENYSGCEWEEITESLYKELVRFENDCRLKKDIKLID